MDASERARDDPTNSRVGVERGAKALGTSADAMRRMMDSMRAVSEREGDDFAGGETAGESCETARLALFLLTLCFTSARGQSNLGVDEVRMSLEDDGYGSSSSQSGATPKSPPPRSPSKRTWRRMSNGGGSPVGHAGSSAFDGGFGGSDDDEIFTAFILRNWEYVVLCCKSDKDAKKGAVRALTRAEVRHLDFILEAFDEDGARASIADSVEWKDGEIEVTQLREWLVRAMDETSKVSSASGVAALAELAAGGDCEQKSSSGSKTIVSVDGAHKTTVVRRQGWETTRTASGSIAACSTSPRNLSVYDSAKGVKGVTPSARVVDCNEAVIYLLEPYHYVSIVGCTDCTVVIGAVARSLRVEGCERLTLICATKRIVVRSCFASTFHLGIMNQPVFVGDNRKCVLAPYNTFYEQLDDHLRAAKLAPEACNAWDRPVVLGSDVTIQDIDSAKSSPDVVRISSGVSLMSTDTFSVFMIPFREYTSSEDDQRALTQANPFDTPANYVAALDAKMQRVNDVRARVRDAQLSDAKRTELQAAIQVHFKDWLASSGKSREIFDLSAIERDAPNRNFIPSSPQRPRQH